MYYEKRMYTGVDIWKWNIVLSETSLTLYEINRAMNHLWAEINLRNLDNRFYRNQDMSALVYILFGSMHKYMFKCVCLY